MTEYDRYSKLLKRYESMMKSLNHYMRRETASALYKFCFEVDNSRRLEIVTTSQANELIERAFNDIVGLLKDKNPRVRYMACNSLGDSRFGRWNPFPHLEGMLKDKDDLVRATAAEALGNLGDKRAFIPLMKTIANDKDGYVIGRAIEVLGGLNDKRALQPLLSVLKGSTRYVADPSTHLREAVIALGELGDKRAIDPIIRLLDHKMDNVRRTAAEALNNFPYSKKIESAILKAAIKFKDNDLMDQYIKYQVKNTEIKKRINQSALNGVKNLPGLPPADRGWAERAIRGLSGDVKAFVISKQTLKVEKGLKPERLAV